MQRLVSWLWSSPKCVLAVLTAVVISAWSIAPAVAQEEQEGEAQPAYISFQPPGNQGINHLFINRSMTAAGDYLDSAGVPTGFVRDSRGTITTFNPEGSHRTFVTGISRDGTIVGNYDQTGGFFFQGFLRDPHGTITVFDAPGGASTNVTGISADGSVIGWWYIQGLLQGFVRDARGTFTTFACPASFSTSPSSINEAGEITGTCGSHGFVRSPQGTITVFDPPQGGFGSLSINRAGVIAGYYYVSGPGPHGFLRSPQGAITLIDIPGALTTQINGINDFGTIAGFYSVDIGSVVPIYHGFLRSPQGTITSFDFPGAVATMATSINDFGVVAGTYFPSGAGFLRLPAGFESEGESESDH